MVECVLSLALPDVERKTKAGSRGRGHPRRYSVPQLLKRQVERHLQR